MVSNNYYWPRFFESLDRWGLTDVFLPFILVFVLVFAVLEKIKILGENRNLNVVVALVMAFSTIMPHLVPSINVGFDPVELINGALPQVTVLIVAIMMLMVLIGVFAHDKVFLGLTAPGWIGLFSVVAIVFIFGSSAGWWGGNINTAMQQFLGEEATAIVIMVLVFGLIISFVTRDPTNRASALERIGINVGELFGKK